MATILRDKIKQPEGKDFKLLDAVDVEYGYTKEDGTTITSVQDALDDLNSSIASKAEASHPHAISDVADLQATLDKTESDIVELKARIFIGTYAEYQAANANNSIPVNTIVILTDDNGESSGGNNGSGDSGDSGENSPTATSSKLGEGVLGYMILG